MAWIETYGRYNIKHTAWFFALLALLTLLCINTFVCTTDRVIHLIRARSHFSRYRFFFRFSPHIMHYAMIIILTGYLSSYLFTQVLEKQSLKPGASINLPGSAIQITLLSFDPTYYQGNRLASFNDRVIRPKAQLKLTDGSSEESVAMTYTRSITYKGFGIFLNDFSPKMKFGGMALPVRIDLSIRKDPGVKLYMTGMFLFTLGLFMYLIERFFFKKLKMEVP
jgi:cytochrome c biogenesis protein ResB